MENITQLLKDLNSEDPRNWGKYASCKGQPIEWWFADRYNTREGQEGLRNAKRVCSSCIVKEKCLNLANENDEAFGIWGGLTPVERGYRRMTKMY
jgi:WhiB family redox-sensing transcriptional regulator